MPLTSKISAYDRRWPIMFEAEKARLERVFVAEPVTFHHVGSTAIPGLAAKPEIDVLVVVEREPSDPIDQEMTQLGYVRGTNLSDGHQFYRRDVGGVRTHKVHVCVSGHPQIHRMIRFRDLLSRDDVLRQRYQDLKLQLEAANEGGIREYLQKKAPFIDAVLRGDQPEP